MFFLFEQLWLKYVSAQKAWKKKGEDWVNEAYDSKGNHKDGYGFRYFSDWQRRNPSPKERISTIVRLFLGIVGGLIVAGFFIAVINNSIAEDNKQREKAYAGHSCKAHELGDRVKIEYGEWAGVTGEIVGGCGHEEDYQVKLDAQKFDVPNDSKDPVDVGGRVIGVDTYKNLTNIEKDKKDESK